MVWELLKEAFELDGRILRSLKLLFLHPGELTLEFSANRRASYVSPIRLYLFTSLLFFFVLSVTTEIQSPDTIQTSSGTNDSQVEITDERVKQFKTMIDPDLADRVDDVLARPDSVTAEMMRELIENAVESGEDAGFLERFFYSQFVRAIHNPTNAYAALMDNAPVALFFLLPAYAVLLQLLYFRQPKYFVEHLVFALHLHSVAFVIFTVQASVPEQGIVSNANWLLWTAFSIYHFLALRNYYAQRRRTTLVKFVVLLGAYSALLLPAIALVMVTTFAFL